MCRSRFSDSLRGALAALALFVLAGPGAFATEAERPAGVPVTAEPAAVEFLLTSAAKDFSAPGSDRPTAIRKTRVGFIHESNGGNYVLCGSFKSGTGAGAKWTSFATLKTADYEQWLGSAAQGICRQKNIRWYAGNHSAALMRRLGN